MSGFGGEVVVIGGLALVFGCIIVPRLLKLASTPTETDDDAEPSVENHGNGVYHFKMQSDEFGKALSQLLEQRPELRVDSVTTTRFIDGGFWVVVSPRN